VTEFKENQEKAFEGICGRVGREWGRPWNIERLVSPPTSRKGGREGEKIKRGGESPSKMAWKNRGRQPVSSKKLQK